MVHRLCTLRCESISALRHVDFGLPGGNVRPGNASCMETMVVRLILQMRKYRSGSELGACVRLSSCKMIGELPYRQRAIVRHSH